MKTKRYLPIAIAALALSGTAAPAAERSVMVSARTKIVDGHRQWHEDRTWPYVFRIEVISEGEGMKPEGSKWGRPFVTAYPGEEYRVRIHNPMPVRVAVNLSIDGLNSLTGRPGTPDGGKKWVVEPESWVDIAGWQVSGREARRFYFTSRGESYATWRSNSWGKDLSVNCGVIGAAFFWSQEDIDRWFDDHPIVIRPPRRGPSRREDEMLMSPGAKSRATGEGMRDEPSQHAGTGMGERESHPVREVRFEYDRGMYRPSEAVIVYYDFPEERRRPRPYSEPGYAPEYAPEPPDGPRPYGGMGREGEESVEEQLNRARGRW